MTTNDMPEVIWARENVRIGDGWHSADVWEDHPNGPYIRNSGVKYIRADLVPGWQDKPDAPGSWITMRPRQRISRVQEITLDNFPFPDTPVLDATYGKARWFGPFQMEKLK